MGQEHSSPSRELHAQRRRRVASHSSGADIESKSDNSSTESSGYRSGSTSGYDYHSASERSSSSEYYHFSLYKNDHYKHINRELYKPVKIPKDKRHRLQFHDAETTTNPYLDNHLCIKYLSDTESKTRDSEAKRSGIRNYKPKILSDGEQKKIENWI